MAIRPARKIAGFAILFSGIGPDFVFDHAYGQGDTSALPEVLDLSSQIQGHWRPSRYSDIRPRELGIIVEFLNESNGMVRFVSCNGEAYEVRISVLDRVDGQTCDEGVEPPGTFSPTIGNLGLLALIESSSGVWMASAEGVYARAGSFSFEEGGMVEYASDGTLSFQIQPSDAFLSQFAQINMAPMELQSARVTLPIDALDFLPNDSGGVAVILTDPSFGNAITEAIVGANLQ